MSQNLTFAPARSIAFTVAIKVKDGAIISDPFKFNASYIAIRADVPELKVTAYFELLIFEISFSNLLIILPAAQFDFSSIILFTYFLSFLFRLVL